MDAAPVHRRRKLYMFVVAGLVGGALWACLLRNSEPSYKGRSLSMWVDQYGDPFGSRWSQLDKEEAAHALRQIGTNALPYLLTWIDYEPPDTPTWRNRVSRFVWEKFPYWISQSRLAMALYANKPRDRAAAAAEAFAALGQVASPAAPELVRRVKLANSPNRRQYAVFALAHLGPLGAPTIGELLSDPSGRDTFWLMACITVLGTNAEPLIPKLLQNLKSTNCLVALSSVRTLQYLRLDGPIVVPELAKCLHGPCPDARREACTALMGFGEVARLALPALTNALADTNADVRRLSGEAIESISSAAPSSASLLSR